MPGRKDDRWIVLLDKFPRGPLTEAEIHQLLQAKILRHNDLAFQVVEAGETAGRTQWKLLWQFEPFNRRAEKPASQTEPAGNERRAPNPAPRERSVIAPDAVPDDLRDIAPEQLIPRTTLFAPPVPVVESESSSKGPESGAATSLLERMGPGTRLAVVGLIAITGAWAFYSQGPQEGEPPSGARRPLSSAAQMQEQSAAATPKRRTRTATPTPTAPVASAPRPAPTAPPPPVAQDTTRTGSASMEPLSRRGARAYGGDYDDSESRDERDREWEREDDRDRERRIQPAVISPRARDRGPEMARDPRLDPNYRDMDQDDRGYREDSRGYPDQDPESDYGREPLREREEWDVDPYEDEL